MTFAKASLKSSKPTATSYLAYIIFQELVEWLTEGHQESEGTH